MKFSNLLQKDISITQYISEIIQEFRSYAGASGRYLNVFKNYHGECVLVVDAEDCEQVHDTVFITVYSKDISYYTVSIPSHLLKQIYVSPSRDGFKYNEGLIRVSLVLNDDVCNRMDGEMLTGSD